MKKLLREKQTEKAHLVLKALYLIRNITCYTKKSSNLNRQLTCRILIFVIIKYLAQEK